MLSVDEVLSDLQTKKEGLSALEVKNRQNQYGFNQLEEVKVHAIQILWRQLHSPFIYLLFVATVIALFLGDSVEAGMIFFFVILNTGLGFYQEYKAEQTIYLLRKYVIAQSKVRREGKDGIISSVELVPGDIVIVEPGDVIPADLRFIDELGLMIDESTITGESIPIKKITAPLDHEAAQLFQAQNIGIMGTTVISGKGIGVVIGTAKKTMLGDIAQITVESTRETIFAREIGVLSRVVVVLVLSTIALVFFLNVIFKGAYVPLGQLFIFAMALAVTITPEALPIVITFCLSRGALQLARNKVVVKRLSAIVDLGSIDILCSDKTGTLTENKLTVAHVFGQQVDMTLLLASVASSMVMVDHLKQRYNPIDEAFWIALNEQQQKEVGNYKLIYDVPFDPIRLRNTVVAEHEGVLQIIVRGVIETTLDRCIVSDEQKKEIRAWSQEQELQGRRVLIIANKVIQKSDDYDKQAHEEQDLAFLGLTALEDPIKKDVAKAVVRAKELGVIIKILTGDSPEVAQAVGKQIGIISSADQVMTGAQFSRLSEQAKREAIYTHVIFARVEPQQKYEIIKLLQEKNQVGYLGDGINDAPALKVAHVGLVVQGAADIARDAADIILLKKSLNVIIDGIYQGRIVFANTIKYLKSSFSSVFSNFYSVAIASLFLDYLPMLPLQILLINLLSDFPLIAVSTDTVDTHDLRTPKAYAVKDIFMLTGMLAVVSSLCDFIVVYLFYRISPAVLQTNWFIESILSSLVAIYCIRTRMPFFKAKRPSLTLMSLTAVSTLVAVVLPLTALGQKLFSFSPPTFKMYLYIVFIVIVCFIGLELVKLLYYRLLNGRLNGTNGVK